MELSSIIPFSALCSGKAIDLIYAPVARCIMGQHFSRLLSSNTVHSCFYTWLQICLAAALGRNFRFRLRAPEKAPHE